MKSNFLRGMYHGIPIALGYLSVSFGFGIMAAKAGLSVFAASAVSATNLTSAGQAAGVDIIAAGGTIIEMILVQLTINIRYSLMALSLSQKLDRKFTLPHRLAARVDERPAFARKAPLRDHQSARRQNRRVLAGENFPHMHRHAGKIPCQPVCDAGGEAAAAVAVVCKCVSSAHIQSFPSTNHCG